jgi:hypothetical protein
MARGRGASEETMSVVRSVRWAAVAATVVLGSALAQGELRGEVHADEVGGTLVIACLPSAVDGCDEGGSAYAEVVGTGPRGTFVVAAPGVGPYLLIGWRDADGDGEPDDDEIVVLLDAAGEPALVTAPASGLVIGTPQAPGARAPTPAAQVLTPDLVGVWQMTRASAGDYRDLSTGFAFSMTSGFNTQLKLRADGSFSYVFYSSGTASDCAMVSSFDTAGGRATFDGRKLVLLPSERTLEVRRCAETRATALPLDPLVFDATLTEAFDFHGHRMWTLDLVGGDLPLSLTLLHRPPSADPPRPRPGADFVTPVDPPYQEILGLWSPELYSTIDFFDPEANTYYLPEYNTATPLWLRLEPGGYQLGRAWADYSIDGVCDKDYVYYERGRAAFVITEARDGDSFVGHARFDATDARLVVVVRDCGADDGATLYTLTPQTSSYAWRYVKAWTSPFASGGEQFGLSCPWERSEWQFMVCDGFRTEASFQRRE